MSTHHMYSAPISITSAFTTQIDIFEFLSGTNMPVVVYGFEIGQTSEVGDAQEEVLTLVLKRVTASPTSGSGGGTSTPQPINSSGAAVAAGTAFETGNTTKLTGGTSVDMARIPWNVRQPYLYRPLPEEMIILAPATRLVLELATTPTDSIGGIVGWFTFAEIL